MADAAPIEYLSPQQVARLLGGDEPLSVATLARWRADGVGPKWFRCGFRKVRYSRVDVEAYMEAQRMAPVARGPRARLR